MIIKKRIGGIQPTLTVIFGVVFLCCFLVACQQIWYFKITDMSDPAHPVFCFSSRSDCKGDAAFFAFLDIEEIDENYRPIQSMWMLQANEDKPGFIKKLQYGTVPAGYTEWSPAKPLKLNCLYAVHGRYFFILKEVNGTVEATVYTHEEFYKFIYKGE